MHVLFAEFDQRLNRLVIGMPVNQTSPTRAACGWTSMVCAGVSWCVNPAVRVSVKRVPTHNTVSAPSIASFTAPVLAEPLYVP